MRSKYKLMKKLLVFTNLFPNDDNPTRATFNRLLLEELNHSLAVDVVVAVLWREWFESTDLQASRCSTLSPHYFR